MSYEGKWHVEGETENICAAGSSLNPSQAELRDEVKKVALANTSLGVYYAEVSEYLMGGSLKFRPPETPQEHYNIEETSINVPIRTVRPHRSRHLSRCSIYSLPTRERRLYSPMLSPIVSAEWRTRLSTWEKLSRAHLLVVIRPEPR